MSRLALFGGQKTVAADYEKAANLPLVNDKGIEAAVGLMRKGEISSSPLVGKFEKRFADYIGTKYALCSTNGTSSLQEALFAVGVKSGDEVIVPSYTYWATAVPIVSVGAIPVFTDVDRATYCIDPVEIERNISPRTKAIMLVHVWGNPADMDAILGIAGKFHLAVIEDCSHAHGARWKEKKAGSIGDVGCFSFQGSKLIAAGEGGILVTGCQEYYERAAALGHYERIGSFHEGSQYKKYELTGLGYKFRIHPVAAAIADSALDELDERNKIRNSNAMALEKGLEDIACIKLQKAYDGAEREYSYHFAAYDAAKLDHVPLAVFLKALKAEGVRCGFCGYGRLHKAPFFTEANQSGSGDRRIVKLPVTEYLAANTFMLAPRFEKACPALIEEYIEAYHKVAGNAGELKEYAKAGYDENMELHISGRSINLL